MSRKTKTRRAQEAGKHPSSMVMLSHFLIAYSSIPVMINHDFFFFFVPLMDVAEDDDLLPISSHRCGRL